MPETNLFDSESIHANLNAFGVDPNSDILTNDMLKEMDETLLDAMNERLSGVFSALHERNLGLLDKVTRRWVGMPTYVKYSLNAGGIVVSIASFPIHSTALLIGGAGYFAANYVLHNHFESNPVHNGRFEETIQNVTKFVSSLCVYLTCTQMHLNKQCEALEQSIAELKAEKESLKVSLHQFQEEVTHLNHSIDHLELTGESLQLCNEQLQKANHELDSHKQRLEEINSELEEKLKELESIKTQQQEELNRLAAVNRTLEGSVRSLIDSLTLDEEKRDAFMQRLNTFLADETQAFHNIAERICRAEEQYQQLNGEHQALVQQYEELNDRFAQGQERLEENARRYEQLLQRHQDLLEQQLQNPDQNAVQAGGNERLVGEVGLFAHARQAARADEVVPAPQFN